MDEVEKTRKKRKQKEREGEAKLGGERKSSGKGERKNRNLFSSSIGLLDFVFVN